MKYMIELFNYSTKRYITCTPADTMMQMIKVYLKTRKMQKLYKEINENAKTCVRVYRNGHYMLGGE